MELNTGRLILIVDQSVWDIYGEKMQARPTRGSVACGIAAGGAGGADGAALAAPRPAGAVQRLRRGCSAARRGLLRPAEAC